MPATARPALAAVAAVAAGGLVFSMWQLAEAVGLLEWRSDYGGGADDLWQGNLTVHAWLIGTGTALAGLLAARFPTAGQRAYPWAAVGALVGGLMIGAVLGGTVAATDRGEVLQVGVVAAVAGALAVLAGAVSAGALPGLVLGAALPWAAFLVWPYALASPGFAGTQLRVDSVLVPLACTLLPSLLAAAVGARGGAGWAGVLLGAVLAPGMLLIAYHVAGPGGGDHLSQSVPYWFIHVLAPTAVVAVAVRRGAVTCWRSLAWPARMAALLAGPVATTVLFVPSERGFTLGRDTRIPFTAEVVVLVTGAACALLAGIAVAAAAGWKAGWQRTPSGARIRAGTVRERRRDA